MITNLEYRNFKSWKETGALKLAPLTGFFGANSSGKTSLLQGLLLLKQTAETSDRNQILYFGDENSYVELGSFEEVIFRHIPQDLYLSIHWDLSQNLTVESPETPLETLFSSSKMAFETTIGQKAKGQLSVKDTAYRLGDDIFKMSQKVGKEEYELSYYGQSPRFRFVKQMGRKWPLPPPFKFYGFPDQVKAYYQNAGFLSDLQLELEKRLQTIYYLGPLRENPKRQYSWKGAQPSDMGRRGEKVVDAILTSDNRGWKIRRGPKQHQWLLGKYVAYWLKELGLISTFRISEIKEGSGSFQVLVKKNASSEEVLITDVGFGVSQILPVLTLCYYVPEGATVIIEQPEIHLHPSVQAGLADVFLDAIKHKKIQILLESHSEHLLRRLQLRIAEAQIPLDEAQLYFCEMSNGASKISLLQMDAYGTILNWPHDFFGDEFGEIAAINLAKIKRLKNQ